MRPVRKAVTKIARPARATKPPGVRPILKEALADQSGIPFTIGGHTATLGIISWDDNAAFRAVKAAILDEAYNDKVAQLFRDFSPDDAGEERLSELLAFLGSVVLISIRTQVVVFGLTDRVGSPDQMIESTLRITHTCQRAECRRLFLSSQGASYCPDCQGLSRSKAPYMRAWRRNRAVVTFGSAVRAYAQRYSLPSMYGTNDATAERYLNDPQFRKMVDLAAEVDPDVHAARRRLKRNQPKRLKSA